jgi:flagellin FlaB
MFSTESRGQIGVGTLIVFISMVLVAAVAAGVLFETSGKLQQQASATSEESTEQVSSGVKIQTVLMDIENGGADNIRVYVTPRSGSDIVRLGNSSILYVDNQAGGVRRILTYDSFLVATDSTFEIDTVSDESDSAPTMDSQQDVFEMIIDTNDIGGNNQPLAKGESADITINPELGTTNSIEVTVPETAQNGETVRVH